MNLWIPVWAAPSTQAIAELQNIRLNHFRVDRISGADNDRHKTERVRVNNEPKTQRDVYGSRINQ